MDTHAPKTDPRMMRLKLTNTKIQTKGKRINASMITMRHIDAWIATIQFFFVC